MARYLEPEQQSTAIGNIMMELTVQAGLVAEQFPISADPKATRGDTIRRVRAAIELLPAFRSDLKAGVL